MCVCLTSAVNLNPRHRQAPGICSPAPEMSLVCLDAVPANDTFAFLLPTDAVPSRLAISSFFAKAIAFCREFSGLQVHVRLLLLRLR